MKIGIITILRVNNYGAELQAYATQKALQLLGYKAEIVDYLFYKNPKHQKTSLSAPTLKPSFSKSVREFLFPLITKWKTRNSKAATIRNARFESFHNTYTKTSRQYSSYDDLKNAKLDYDVLISGSDQIWNPGNHTSLDPYFLLFAAEKVKRVAYASSFGVTQIPNCVKDYYCRALNKYNAIGVREDTAVELVRNLSGKEAQLVLDPTLLLSSEEWLKVAKPIESCPDSPFILIYELGNIPYIKQLALHISRHEDMKIVRVCQSAAPEDAGAGIINIVDAGPSEFIYLFSRAAMVLTNSFHGTAFSLNFSKQFFTIIPVGKSNNSRQKSILNLCQCTHRAIEENAPYPQLTPYDVNVVQNILEQERKQSITFLQESLND